MEHTPNGALNSSPEHILGVKGTPLTKDYFSMTNVQLVRDTVSRAVFRITGSSIQPPATVNVTQLLMQTYAFHISDGDTLRSLNAAAIEEGISVVLINLRLHHLHLDRLLTNNVLAYPQSPDVAV